MTRFDRDTEPEPLSDGRLRVRFDPGWFVLRGPNGGYVAAVLARALRAEVGPERPLRSLTVHYLAAPAAGEADVAVRVERSGRTMTFASVRCEQDGRTVALALAALGGAFDASVAYHDVEMPDVPPPEQLGEPRSWTQMGGPTFAEHFEYVPAGPAPFHAAAHARTGGWIRLREPRPLDEAALVALADAWWPAPYMVVERFFAAPTIDLTVHLRAPLPREHDYVLIDVRSDSSRDGYFEEDVRLFHRDGTLLAHGRQLALAL
ncbi:MAG: thioesterase family protein [Solirubrobacterales bacterium]